MPRSITFNGQTLYKPGALSRVTASPNRRSNPGSTGIVALIGEADGGEAGIHIFTDPLQVKGALVDGPLANAAAAVFDPSNDPVIPGGAASVVAYKVNSGTQAGIRLPSASAVLTSTVAALSTSTSVVWAGGGLAPNAHTNRWLKVGTGATAQYRRITGNSSSNISVTPALPGAPTVGDAAVILANQINLTARQYGTSGNQVSVEFEQGDPQNSYVFTASTGSASEQSPWLFGTPYFNLLFTGGPVATDGTGAVVSATASSLTFTAPNAILQNAFAGYVLEVDVPGYGLLRRKIASPAGNTAAANPGDPVTVYIAAPNAFNSAIVTAINASVGAGFNATVYAVTDAVGSFTGSSGVCTGFSASTTQVPLSPVDDISLTFSTAGLHTLKDLADYINANCNYQASVGAGINPLTPLAEMDFGANNTNVNVLADAFINQSDPTLKGQFRRDLQSLVDWINANCTLVNASRSTGAAAEGAELPSFTGGVAGSVRDVFVWLVGGTRGVSSNSTWQAGFDALRDHRANQIVPLISQDLSSLGQGSTATLASVSAQLAAHVAQCNGQYKNERGAFIGVHQIDPLEASASFNSRDVQVTFQRFTLMDVNGNLVEMPEWSSAVIAAGMRAGGLGESLTRKYPRVTALNSGQINPANRDICNALLMAGVLFAETLPNNVVRWVRDITTYQNDDLETSIDGQTRDVVRFIAYDLRTFIEDTFTGARVINASAGAPSTVTAVRTQAIARLTAYTQQQLLIISQDPLDPTVTVPGFDRVRVTLDGSLLKLSCRIFPTVTVNFETLDITTEIPLLTAGA